MKNKILTSILAISLITSLVWGQTKGEAISTAVGIDNRPLSPNQILVPVPNLKTSLQALRPQASRERSPGLTRPSSRVDALINKINSFQGHLGDSDEFVRAIACRDLGDLPEFRDGAGEVQGAIDQAAAYLAARLDFDVEEVVQLAAVRSLGKLGALTELKPGPASSIIKLLSKDTTGLSLKKELLRAICAMKYPSADLRSRSMALYMYSIRPPSDNEAARLAVQAVGTLCFAPDSNEDAIDPGCWSILGEVAGSARCDVNVVDTTTATTSTVSIEFGPDVRREAIHQMVRVFEKAAALLCSQTDSLIREGPAAARHPGIYTRFWDTRRKFEGFYDQLYPLLETAHKESSPDPAVRLAVAQGLRTAVHSQLLLLSKMALLAPGRGFDQEPIDIRGAVTNSIIPLLYGAPKHLRENNADVRQALLLVLDEFDILYAGYVGKAKQVGEATAELMASI